MRSAPRTLIFKRPLLTGAFAATTVLCLFEGALAHQTATQTGKGAKPNTTSGAPPTQTKSVPNSSKSTGTNTTTGATLDPSSARFDFEHWTTDEQTGITHATVFRFSQDDMVVTGNTAQLNQKTDILDCEGNIVMDDTKHHMTCEKAHMDHVEKKRKLRLATFTGHVVLVMKPDTQASASGSTPPASSTPTPPAGKPAPGTPAPPATGMPAAEEKQPQDEDGERKLQEKRRGGTATCDHLDYKYATKYSILTGHVVFTQRFQNKDGKQIERTLTCEHAEYDSKADTLHLYEPVHYEDNQNQDIKTNNDVIVGTKEGAETTEFTGPSTFILPRQQDEDEDDNQDAKASRTTPKQTDKTTKPPK